MSTLDLSIVVPVYGGEATIEPLCTQLGEELRRRDWRYEILLVCDRPVDGSWAVAKRLATTTSEVIAIRLQRNVGQHAALLLGIRQARGGVIVTMDEDLQHAPADVPALVDTVLKHHCLAYGVTVQQHHGAFRNASSRLIKWAIKRYLEVEDAQHLSAFRAFPARERSAFTGYNHPNVAIDVLLSWTGLPVRAVATSHNARAAGESGYTFTKLVAHLANLAFGFSTAPLRLASYIGFGAVLFAGGLFVYAIVNWMIHGSGVPGFAFTIASLAALGGAQLLALGLIGEYLGRLYLGSLGRPQYRIAEQVGTNHDETDS
ncbi:MAG: glycosyltransferase [Myxococcales bacterium]|nr:glycosyltransferase [Myxococcales bacterium]